MKPCAVFGAPLTGDGDFPRSCAALVCSIFPGPGNCHLHYHRSDRSYDHHDNRGKRTSPLVVITPVASEGFDGNTLKWELTSLDSNHKTSTTTNVNANSQKCDADNTTNGDEVPTYILYPNPVNGILYIDQDVQAMVTVEVFDFFGVSYLRTQLDGSNAPTTHAIDMGGSVFPKGMYFIRLTANSDVQVFTVIKDD